MTVYNKSGTALRQIYNRGETLDLGFDKQGNIIYNIEDYSKKTDPDPVIPKYSINKVQSYFRDRLTTVANIIKGMSSQWQSFVVITDVHMGKLQMNHSAEIAMYLLDNTPCDKIITLGDYCNMEWNKKQYQQYMHKFIKAGFRSYVYPVFGNHETIGGKTVEAKTTLFNDFLSKKDVYGQPTSMYYFWDNTTTKTRFVVINTSDANAYRVGTTQLEWIKTAVNVPDSTWHVLVFGHVNLYDLGGVTVANMQNPAEIITAIKTCTGNLVGYFCGHQHIDSTTNANSFRQTIFLNDRNETTNYYPGYSVIERPKGTLYEQAVSVVSVNTSTKRVEIRRIGAGRSNVYTY